MWQNFDGAGLSQVTSHTSGQLHLQREKAAQNQSTNSLNPWSVSTIPKPKFSSKELIVKAEILQALKTDSNFSFASADSNEKVFWEIFAESDIAKGYKQSEAKIKYSIQFGLAPYFMQSLQNGFLGRAFSFTFNEITTCQVKKTIWWVYTILVEFHKIYCDIVLWITFCWPLLFWNFGRAFFWVCIKNNLDINYLLHIATDGPNVKLKFQKLLMNANILTNINKLLLDIDGCPLYVVHNSFCKGVAALNFDVDQYALDIQLCSKLSAGLRADYKSVGDVTNIVSEYAMKHSTTRWVTLRKVVVRLFEQNENLKD